MSACAPAWPGLAGAPPVNSLAGMAERLAICPLDELPSGARRIVEWEDVEIVVFNCDGTLYAIEDRCSHDDGPLGEGDARLRRPRPSSARATARCSTCGRAPPRRCRPTFRSTSSPSCVEDGMVAIEVD